MTDLGFCHNCFKEISGDKCPCCGYEPKKYDDDDSPALRPGTMLNGKYKVGRILGTGGFGVTYKAINTQNDIVVAIKEYVPANIVYRDIKSNDLELKMSSNKKLYDEGLAAFIDEANFLVLLKNCANIVRVFDCFNENKTAYFAMEFLDGCTLDNVHNINFNFAYLSMLKTANALKIVHKRGIVHRDISPQNIFVANNREIKLIDFGNARFMKGSPNDDRLVLKPGYAPPELYMKQNAYGPWTDIYSLAATFYRVVTKNKLPNALERINGAAIVPIRKYIPDIEYGLEYAINHALELDYVKRPKSVEEFLDEIDNPKMKYDTVNTVVTDPDSLSLSDAGYPNRINVIKKPEPPSRQTQQQKDVVLPKPPPISGMNGGRSGANKGKTAYIQGYDGRRYSISDTRELIVGRNPSTSHIVVADTAISRKHCVIQCNTVGNEFYITDWSSNGTFFMNGAKIPYGARMTLKAGGEFYVSSKEYRFKAVIE